MMAVPCWTVRELVGLLNICNEESLGLRIDTSLRTPSKLVLFHIDRFPIQGIVGGPFKFPMFGLSDNLQEIGNFLGLSLEVTLDKRFRPEEVFEMVVKHRFFHISNITSNALHMRPYESPKEYLILNEFRLWWNNPNNVYRSTMRRCFTRDEVTELSLFAFNTDKKLFEVWLIDYARRRIQLAQMRIDVAKVEIEEAKRQITNAQRLIPGAAPIQVPQQQDHDREAPYLAGWLAQGSEV